MRLVALTLAGSMLLVSACTSPLVDDRCGPVFRVTRAQGTMVSAVGTQLGTAEVRLYEVRGESPPRRVHPIIMGPGTGSAGAPLKGHVTAATVVDALSRVLLTLPVVPGPGDQVLAATGVPVSEEAAFTLLRETILAGNAALVLFTDLPEFGEVRVPLPLQDAGGWGRAHCS